MRIVVTMAAKGNNPPERYEIPREDFDQFFNDEAREYSARPATFFGHLMNDDGTVSEEATPLLGIDIRKVNYT